MKILSFVVLVLVTVVASKEVSTKHENSAHGYHTDIGIPLAKEIRAAEEAQLQSTRISGGLPAVLGQFPYQAGIVIDLISGEQSICGGAILTNLRVLTAAHCWWNRRDQAWRFTVVGGATTVFTGGLRRVTSQVIMHGDWNPDTNQNNIAMVYLATTFTLSASLAVIPLPSGTELQEDFVNYIATASGYGIRSDDSVIVSSQFLSFANVHVITNAECLRTLSNIQPSHICTHGRGNGGSVCLGDAGSPLALTRNGTRRLIGITTLVSHRGCELGDASAFTRITHYIDWIQNLL